MDERLALEHLPDRQGGVIGIRLGFHDTPAHEHSHVRGITLHLHFLALFIPPTVGRGRVGVHLRGLMEDAYGVLIYPCLGHVLQFLTHFIRHHITARNGKHRPNAVDLEAPCPSKDGGHCDGRMHTAPTVDRHGGS